MVLRLSHPRKRDRPKRRVKESIFVWYIPLDIIRRPALKSIVTKTPSPRYVTIDIKDLSEQILVWFVLTDF